MNYYCPFGLGCRLHPFRNNCGTKSTEQYHSSEGGGWYGSTTTSGGVLIVLLLQSTLIMELKIRICYYYYLSDLN